MSALRFFLTIGVFFLSQSNAMAQSPVYENASPQKYCESALEVGKKVSSCKENSKLLRSAIDCVRKFKAERQVVLNSLNLRIRNLPVDGQNSALEKAKKAYVESQKAYDYLFQIGKVMMKEIDSYFDEVVYPEHYESDEEILATACYKEVVEPLDRIAQEVENLTADAAGKWEAYEENIQELKNGIQPVPMSQKGDFRNLAQLPANGRPLSFVGSRP